jgi:hypothetical protein
MPNLSGVINWAQTQVGFRLAFKKRGVTRDLFRVHAI